MRKSTFLTLVLICGSFQALQIQAAKNYKSGKFMIAALLPVTKGQHCQIVERRTLQLVETFIYEMKELNSKLEARSNLTIGYIIKDSCSNPSTAINEAMRLVFVEKLNSTCVTQLQDCRTNKIITVLGPEILENVVLCAGVLSFHRFPQVIFTGKTRLHSNTALYSTLTSIARPISDSVSALTMLIASFDWKSVNVLGSDDMYGREFTSLLNQNLRAYNICVATEKLLDTRNLDVQLPEAIAALRSKPQVTVTVLVARPDMAGKVLEEARRQNVTAHVWMGSESWTADKDITSRYSDVLEGMLGIGYSVNKDEELSRYIEKETRGLSYADWMKTLFGRNVTSGFNKQVIKSRDLQFDKSKFVQDAFQAIGHALENVLTNITQVGNKTEIFNVNPSQVREGINTVLPEYIRARSGQYEFVIINYQRLTSGNFKFVTVGSWRRNKSRKGELIVDHRAVRWPGTYRYLVPFSGSVRPCQPGTFVKNEPMRCGWECVQCPVGTYSNNYTSPICQRCPLGQIPDQLQTHCLVAEEEFVRLLDVYGICILSASVLGFTTTGVVLVIFLKYQSTPVIKASNIGFCLFTLVLLLVWFLSSILFLGEPRDWTCKLRTVGIPLLYISVSALLLTKTKRLIRIFSSLKRNRFLSNYWYSFVACSIVLVQVIFSAVYLAFFPPERVNIFHDNLTVSTHCSRNLGMEIASFGYNCLLAFLCASFAIKSRNLPETYSEAIHICLTMLTDMISWMVYFFGYYGIPQGKLKVAVPSFGVIIGAYAVLFFIFVPKIRVILFLPEKNTKKAALAGTRKYSVDVACGIQLSISKSSRACERRHTLATLPAYHESGISSLGNLDNNGNALGSRFSPEGLGEAIKEDEDVPEEVSRNSFDNIRQEHKITIKNLAILTPNGLA
ncbi:hypothetical protein QZH41_010298 [Actinostola sp. cb2023]|nr:hypothetical protein QZH41_010298 [Actinostola sp. cb2023]